MTTTAADDPRRRIPGLDTLLERAEPLVERWGRARAISALREALEAGRSRVAAGEWPGDPADAAHWLAAASEALHAADLPTLRPVLNATGVVLHTNLGRARLAPEAVRAAAEAASAYSNLEFDLEEGRRGSRYDHARELLCELTGAEDALVVNNCAAGLILALSAAARGREVVLSRGELVEIGGGFRIPEVMERAGCTLREVGTTNRTRLADYRDASESISVGALLKVHRSNFALSGFTSEAGLDELVALGRQRNLPVLHDLGSGLLLPPARLGLPEEPTPSGSVAAGVDAVVFSGDKLLGGPQAGLIVGRTEILTRMRRDPFCRAFRVDKGTLAALAATLRLYRDPESAVEGVPTLRAIAEGAEALRGRTAPVAKRLRGRLGEGVGLEVVATTGRVGGGTFPDHEIPSAAMRLTLQGDGDESLSGWAARARTVADPLLPLVGRIEGDGWLLDLRTVLPDEVDALVETIVATAPGGGRAG